MVASILMGSAMQYTETATGDLDVIMYDVCNMPSNMSSCMKLSVEGGSETILPLSFRRERERERARRSERWRAMRLHELRGWGEPEQACEMRGACQTHKKHDDHSVSWLLSVRACSLPFTTTVAMRALQ